MPIPVIDLTGQRFGHLIAINRDSKSTADRGAHWLCRCDCGNKTIKASHFLRKGEATSCGCVSGRNVVGIIGKRFGRLVVCAEVGRSKHGGRLFSCKCDCGGTKHVTHSNLRKGDTRSCG